MPQRAFRAADIPETVFIFNNTFVNNSHDITGGDNTVVRNNIFIGHSVIAVKKVDAGSELAFNLFFNNGTDNSGSNVGWLVWWDRRKLLASQVRKVPYGAERKDGHLRTMGAAVCLNRDS